MSVLLSRSFQTDALMTLMFQAVAERLAALGFEYEYFVITFFPEYRKNRTDLAAYLEPSCALRANDGRYLIYENYREPDSGIAD